MKPHFVHTFNAFFSFRERKMSFRAKWKKKLTAFVQHICWLWIAEYINEEKKTRNSKRWPRMNFCRIFASIFYVVSVSVSLSVWRTTWGFYIATVSFDMCTWTRDCVHAPKSQVNASQTNKIKRRETGRRSRRVLRELKKTWETQFNQWAKRITTTSFPNWYCAYIYVLNSFGNVQLKRLKRSALAAAAATSAALTFLCRCHIHSVCVYIDKSHFFVVCAYGWLNISTHCLVFILFIHQIVCWLSFFLFDFFFFRF